MLAWPYVLVVIAAVDVSIAQAQGTTNADTIVLMSASGGIAKGSYQGGVDFVINEFLRRQRIPAFRLRVGLKSDGVPYRLGSATGASAGNVNALLASVSWCTESIKDPVGAGVRTKITPDESMFWKTWVNTGFSQIFLKSDGKNQTEPAVLDRRFFEDVHKKIVWTLLTDATPVKGCDIPMGVTMTRLSPIQVSITDDKGSADVQRFATVLNVRTLTDANGKSWIDLQPPSHRVERSGSLGALALLSALGSTAHGSREKRLDALFNVVVASSSFPVAFSPKLICYTAGGLAAKRPTMPPGGGPSVEAPLDSTCARFNDGGLFDNNPFALAVRLFERNYDPAATVPTVLVAYSNPNLYRGTLETARRPEEDKEDRTGIGAIIQMIQGALPSGREYELHSLARLMRRDEEMRSDLDDLKHATAGAKLALSSRSQPIMGEQLGSFAGFLGRPFREYDFYTGVYDGLEFVARNFLCVNRAHGTLKTCVDSTHVALIDNNVFDLDGLSLTVARWHRKLEYGAGPAGAPAVFTARQKDVADQQKVDTSRLTLLTSIHREMTLLRTRQYDIPCKVRNDPIASRLCRTGLDVLFDHLSKDTGFTKAAARLRKWCDAHTRERKLGDCSADGEFIDLIDHTRRYLHGLVERALTNLENAEDAIRKKDPSALDFSPEVEAAYSTYRTASLRYRRGVAINPSSALWDHSSVGRTALSLTAFITPNYLNIIGGGRASDPPVLRGVNRVRETSIGVGWHPIVIRPWEHFTLNTTFELSKYQDVTVVTDRRWDKAYGASLGSAAWTIPGFSSMEIGALSSRHSLSVETKTEQDRQVVLHLSGRLLFEKLQLSVRWAPHHSVSGVFGFSDLNGLLYWWWR